MADPVDTLRSARPSTAEPDPDAFDAALLARVRQRPVRRGRPRLALPAAGLAAAGTAAVLVLSPAGPSATAAVRNAQRWFDPAPGQVLHMRSVTTSAQPDGGSSRLVQEIWQSVDHPERERHLETSGGITKEIAGSEVYDPATNTIYEQPPVDLAMMRRAFARKIAGARAEGASDRDIARLRADMRHYLAHPDQPGEPQPTPLGDPTVVKVRMLLEEGRASLGDETTYDGVRALPITLHDGPAGEGRPRWTLWTAAADGRPLELRIDTGPGTDAVETTRWTDYDLVPADPALLSLAQAHPGARVVRDAGAYDAAQRRLFPNG